MRFAQSQALWRKPFAFLAPSRPRAYGWVDYLDSYHVSGWALKADRTSADAVVISVDDRPVAEVYPSLFRPDLLEQGMGDGWSGFVFYFPEPVGIRKPSKVLVRARSTGEVLPQNAGGQILTAGNTVDAGIHPRLDPGNPSEHYAATADDIIPSEGHRSWGLTGRVLAPPDAVLSIVPSTSTPEVAIRAFECSPRPGTRPPAPFPIISDFQCDIDIAGDSVTRSVVFDVTDLNPNSPGYGRRPISPVARMCFPLTEDWAAPAGLENYSRTCGTAPRNAFVVSGMTISFQMSGIAKEFLGDREKLTILDWGIGAARVAAPLKRGMMPDAHLIGFDVDNVNVSWCQDNIPDIPVRLCDFYPPLELEANCVDMIYGISVMTHLTADAQLAWLRDLRRVLKPGGICVLSIHGEYALLQAGIQDAMFYRQLAARGISDVLADNNLGPLLELKNYYRSTFQLRRYVEQEWSRYFQIVQYYPAAIQTHQDLVVLRKE